MSDQPLRDQAITSLKTKAEFKTHALTYILVNAFLVALWAMSSGGFFWPIFPMLGWGIALGLHGWESYVRPRPSEERIQREMDRFR